MSKNSQLKAGVILSYLNLLIGNIIPFIYTPVMLRILGQAEYGLFGIANSIMGYIGLLNFGIGSAILRYISKYRAEGAVDKERRVIGLFIKLYSAVALLILIVGTTLSFHLDGYGRSLDPEELDKLVVLVRLMTLNMAIFLPFSIFSSVTIAHEKYIFNRVTGVLSSIAAPCLNLAMLHCGFASVGLVLSSTLLNLISYAIYMIFCFNMLHIIPSFKKCEPGLLKEIFVFSFFAFLGGIVDILYWSTDKLIIGCAIGPVAVAVYGIGATFNGYITNLSTAISGILLPKITVILTKDTPQKELTELFIKVGRLQFIVISFIVSAFIVFGRQFIMLWAGEGYCESYAVALFTMIPVTIPLIQNTGLNILMAMNKHHFRSIVYLAIAFLNILLTFFLVNKYGIVGAAFATCVSYIIGNIFIINWYYYNKIGLNIPLFWKNIFAMMPQMVVFIALGLFVTQKAIIDSWPLFFVGAVLYTLLYVGAAYFFMMNQYEKALFAAPLKKIKARIFHEG